MRENRPYGSEGGVGESRSLPLSETSFLIETSSNQSVCVPGCLWVSHSFSSNRAKSWINLSGSGEWTRSS